MLLPSPFLKQMCSHLAKHIQDFNLKAVMDMINFTNMEIYWLQWPTHVSIQSMLTPLYQCFSNHTSPKEVLKNSNHKRKTSEWRNDTTAQWIFILSCIWILRLLLAFQTFNFRHDYFFTIYSSSLLSPHLTIQRDSLPATCGSSHWTSSRRWAKKQLSSSHIVVQSLLTETCPQKCKTFLVHNTRNLKKEKVDLDPPHPLHYHVEHGK